MISYSKLRGRLFDKKAHTLSSLIFNYHQKHSLKREISGLETKYIIGQIVKNNEYFGYLNDFNDIARFLINVKRNEVDINRLSFEDDKKNALQDILEKYNQFLEQNNLADIADIEKFVFENIDQKEEVDEFENENIHFFESKLQKKILEKITKITLKEKIINNSTIPQTIECFDEFDEVIKTFKLIKKIIIDKGVKESDIKIFTTDVDRYFKIFETISFEYKIPVYSTKGLEIKRYKKGRKYAIEKAKFLYQKLLKLGIKVDIDEIKKEVLNERILNKKGIEITETNQVFFHKDIKYLFLVGANINSFPPSLEKNIFYTPEEQREFYKNNFYNSSLEILNRMKKISKNMYVLFQKSQLSILLDKNDKNEKFEYNTKKEKNNQTYVKVPYELKHSSVSQINTYTKCPKRYFYGYVLSLKAPKEEIQDMEITLKGSIFHKVCEIAVNEGIRDIEQLITKAYEDKEIKEKLKNNVYEELYKVELRGVVKNFLEYIEELDITNSKTEYEIYLDENLKIIDEEKPENYFFKGVIDRMDINNEIKIVDYKSSDKKDKKEFLFEKEKIKDIQLGVYTYWAKQKYNKPVSASLIAFKKGFNEFVKMKECEGEKIMKGKSILAVCYNDEYENKLKDYIFTSVTKIKNGEFNYIDDPDCKYCEFRKICKSDNIQKDDKF